LAKLLERFIEIQSSVFVWDFLCTKGKINSAIKFVPYIYFIKADKEEADRLAGEYTSRTQGVKQRQSQRSMPKTKFSKGIIQGKLMAKEYEGVLLLIATILRFTTGSSVLKVRKGKTFSTEDSIKDWITVVEKLLMWVQWLKSDEIPKKLVKRAKKTSVLTNVFNTESG
jgi:hypothetical protein